MNSLKIVCLTSVLLSLVAVSNFVPPGHTHNPRVAGVFGYTDLGAVYEVDTGAGLVFQVRKTDGSITSVVFNGTEYKSTTNRFSQIASGLGTPTTVTPETDGSTYVKITLQTGPTNTVVANLTHYLIVRNGENTIYMATYPTAEPAVGELRWITRLNSALIPNGPVPSDLHLTTGAIESTDVFGMADGTTRSKYYGDDVTHGKDRAIDLTYNGATGPGIGCWMVFGTRESSSGGPFFRDIENQSGDDQEIYNYMNSGHNQTEPFRLNVLHGPYALVFTTGAPPTLPIDFSWLANLGLTGWVPNSDRGAVNGTANGIPAGFQGVVGFNNATAQYWATVAADGSYSSAGMKPGTYIATLYKGELEVATSPVVVSSGATSTLNLTSTEVQPSTIFRIGEWDGTPAGLMNGEKIFQMHPQDVRMTPWNVTTYTVGVDSPSKFPAIQFRGQNSPTTIKFNLAPNQITNLTLKIGITCAYNNGRPQITVNSFTSGQPAASAQPDSRSFTIGTYRGNNALFTYSIPASALLVGTNTMTINPISGSTDLSQWLSAGWVYDAVELDGPIATPVITYVGGDPLVINGTSEPFRNIELTLDGSIPAGNTVANAAGEWSITYSSPVSAGIHSFTAVASDANGHQSPASAPFTFNTNVTTPEITSAAGDEGTYASGATTSDRTFIFNGTGGAGDQITLTRVGTGVIATVTVDGTGQWSFDYRGVALPAGLNEFYATATNAAGTSPSSAIFTLSIQGTPRITIVRFNPVTPTITTGVSSVIFRVTFRDAVSGVTTGAFALATTGTAAGTISSVSANAGMIFAVTVNNLSGSGTLRLDLKSVNGVVDSGGNPEAGYIAGESYTLVLPTIGNGTWIQAATGGLWSDPANWLNAVIADGGNTANFSTLNLLANNTVHLDSPRSVSSISFGDTDTTTPASWVVDNNGTPGNTLTLTGGTPTITVNALGAGATTSLTTSLIGTAGVAKAGAGTLVLAAPNSLTGVLNVNGGSLQLASGGSLNIGNNAVNTALNTRLQIAGGSFSTTGLVSATTSQVVIDSGSASLGSFRTNSDFSGTLRVNGGALTVGDVNIRRNAAGTPDFTSGFIVTGGVANATTIGLGTQNSFGSMSVEGGSLTASGAITIANQVTAGRGGAMRVLNNAVFTSTDAALGILMCRNNGTNANNVATATFTGGLSTVEKFTLGFDSTVTAGSATISINGGSLYLGAGGIVKNGASGMATNLNFSSGVLGAKSDWSTTLPINLPNGGNITIRAADAGNLSHNITLNGVLSGNGGFTKTGGGRLLLGAANTFVGPVTHNAGILDVDGSIGTGSALTVNSGATLTGDGSVNRTIVLNSGSTLRPGSSSPGSVLSGNSLTWNGDAMMSFELGSTSNRLALTGALIKGTAGSFNFAFTPGPGLAPHNVYTLATFGSSDFTAADLTFTGLPSGLTGQFTVNPGSIVFEIFGPPEIVVQPQSASVLFGGTANFTVTVNPSPQLSYQWFKDNNAITGATGPSLTVSNARGFDIGTYYVVVTNAAGSTVSSPATLSIAPVALVRHAPLLNSSVVQGSIEQMLGEDVTLAGSSVINGDLLVPGTPTVVLNNNPNYGGTLDGSGDLSPSNYFVTLNGGTTLDHVIRRTDPVSLPNVSAPAAPAGTRSVTLNNSNQTVGDWNTVRNLTVNSNLGQIAVPEGAYGDFTAKGGSGFTVGVPGAHLPSIYSFQSLTLNGSAQIQVVGPVLIVIGNGLSLNGGMVGDAANPQWLTLDIFAGSLTLNNGASIFGYVTVPSGTLTINSNCKMNGGAAADRLTINSQGKLQLNTNGN
jgi:autotransporter-associated beta strand protein